MLSQCAWLGREGRHRSSHQGDGKNGTRVRKQPHENRRRNHTCDNSDACRDKSEDARTSPAAVDAGFSLGESDPNPAPGVSPLLRKKRRETSRSDPGVASCHAFKAAPKDPATHATCAVG